MPSIFTNDTSKGPLYQYWRDRTHEEKSLRDQRIAEARIRSEGLSPQNAAYGPSSQGSYHSREGRGPPSYATGEGGDTARATNEMMGSNSTGGGIIAPATDDLPAYIDTTSSSQQERTSTTHLSASEEKKRLNELEAQYRQTQSDATFAHNLATNTTTDPAHFEYQHNLPDQNNPEEEGTGNGKKPQERKRSKVGKVGSWLADAASGYTRNQERW